jgi:hypothetical protein
LNCGIGIIKKWLSFLQFMLENKRLKDCWIVSKTQSHEQSNTTKSKHFRKEIFMLVLTFIISRRGRSSLPGF